MNKPISVVVAATMFGLCSPAMALELWMTARPLTKVMPDGRNVPMWGFALVAETEFSAAELTTPATVPGPRIVIPEGDDTLTIHLRNTLPAPVSLVVPGQVMAPPPGQATAAMPTWVDAAGNYLSTGARPNAVARMRSPVAEAAPGGTATYYWKGLKPGTFLYRSGTNPAVQVPMGLHGALARNVAAGSAYAGVTFDHEVLLHYSEVDPALNDAVFNGTFGTSAYPSTIRYHARYFLVNDKPFEMGKEQVATIGVGSRALVRLLNAGLETHVPTILGTSLLAVAEDGHPYPYARPGHAVTLPPGKTVDAVMVAPAAGRYAVYDRMLELTNGGQSPGGLLSYVQATAGTVVAADDAFAATEDTQLVVPAAGGVLANDTGTNLTASLVTPPGGGTLALASDGGFAFTPATNFSGKAVFTYRASDGTAQSNVASTTITVAPVNDAPTAMADEYSAVAGQELAVPAPGLLQNDHDIDGNTLTATLGTGPANGTLALAANGSFKYTANAGFGGSDSFTYTVSDGSLSSSLATVTITVAQPVNQAPVAADDKARTTINQAVTITVLANDRDPDGSLNPASVQIVTPPNQGGKVVVNANGTVTFTPRRRFRGTDTFTYRVADEGGKWSNTAKVSVDVVR